MTKPLESRVATAEYEQVASRGGEIREDVNLESRTCEKWIKYVQLANISSERERRDASGPWPMANAISVRRQDKI